MSHYHRKRCPACGGRVKMRGHDGTCDKCGRGWTTAHHAKEYRNRT